MHRNKIQKKKKLTKYPKTNKLQKINGNKQHRIKPNKNKMKKGKIKQENKNKLKPKPNKIG